MLRSFARTLRGISLTPFRPSFIGVTLTTTIIRPGSHVKTVKSPPLFTPNITARPMPKPHGQQHHNQVPRWRVTNYFFNVPCTGLALYHWFNQNNDIDVEFKYEEVETTRTCCPPADLYRVDIPGFKSSLPEGFVLIDYAVGSLIQATDSGLSRLWCQHVIVADLPQRLVIVPYGETYICKKDLVDGMNWQAWWRHWVEESRNGNYVPFSSSGSTLVVEEESDGESVGSLDWRPFIEE